LAMFLVDCHRLSDNRPSADRLATQRYQHGTLTTHAGNMQHSTCNMQHFARFAKVTRGRSKRLPFHVIPAISNALDFGRDPTSRGGLPQPHPHPSASKLHSTNRFRCAHALTAILRLCSVIHRRRGS